jgi:hypothetical protein
MGAEVSFYRPLDITRPQIMRADFVNLEGINFDDPSTYKNSDGYKIVGHIPFPYPVSPYPNYRAHHLRNFWIEEGSYKIQKNLGLMNRDNDLFDEDSFWMQSVARALAIHAGKAHSFDYTAGTAEGEKAFIQEEAAFLKTLNGASYNDLFCISILPDRTCFACQATPKGDIGNHCYEVPARDIVDIASITRSLDNVSLNQLYVPFLKSKEGITLGIIISKRNLYLWAGRKLGEKANNQLLIVQTPIRSG